MESSSSRSVAPGGRRRPVAPWPGRTNRACLWALPGHCPALASMIATFSPPAERGMARRARPHSQPHTAGTRHTAHRARNGGIKKYLSAARLASCQCCFSRAHGDPAWLAAARQPSTTLFSETHSSPLLFLERSSRGAQRTASCHAARSGSRPDLLAV